MVLGLLARYWVVIPCALAALFFGLWQDARQDVGAWKEKQRAEHSQAAALESQLSKANAAIQAQAGRGAAAYGRCQDLAASDVTKAFDAGVLYGRSTCAKPSSSPRPSASSGVRLLAAR